MCKIFHALAYIGIGIAALAALLVIFAFCFLRFWPAFGGRASAAAKKNYAERAANFDGKKFRNQEEASVLRLQKNPAPDPLTLSSRPQRPDFEFKSLTPNFSAPKEDELRVTWFGHSSLLLQMHGMNILIDPVFSQVISPVSFAGSRRFSNPGIDAQDLPAIDILLISHDHYDHLDYSLIRSIDKKVKRYIVPLGVENHLVRWKVAKEKITNMAWWEEVRINGLCVTCTPSQHFSGRGITDRMATLWCSWVLQDEHHLVLESGDSGYGSHWEQIHQKFGDFDAVLMECGQYDTMWPKVHMFPEQSVKAACTLGAKIAMPIHWGAIVLSRHGWDDPVERFLKEAEKQGLNVVTPRIGQTIPLSTQEFRTDSWWREQ